MSSVRSLCRDEQKPKMTFPIRKESVLNCLLIGIGNMSFIYTRDRSRKLIGLLGEEKQKLAQMPKIGGNENQ